MKPTEDEVLREIEAIESGASTVTCPNGWGYCGVAVFVTSNRWVFYVFNDCDEFDYFERIVTPDGRELDFDDLAGEALSDPPRMPRLYDYGNTMSRAAELAWGIP